jgi:cytochrome c553
MVPDGNSPLAANPKLAGQHTEYLFKQMKNFKAPTASSRSESMPS